MKALITGVTGQDGSYLAEHLLHKGYEVIGISSGRSSGENIESIKDSITWLRGDLTDGEFTTETLSAHMPDEIYNLAALVATAQTPENIEELVRINALTPVSILNWITRCAPHTRFFQASTSEMYGDAKESPQSEATPFLPQTPYGISKLFAHQMTGQYRNSHKVFAVSGILFNHESPRRPANYVTRKITSALARIARGSKEILELGNLDVERDWSFAGDIMNGIWLSLQAEKPDTYVFASGEMHTVREFVETAAALLNMTIAWEGVGYEEKGRDAHNNVIVAVNSAFFRQAEASPRRGDISHAHTTLGWESKMSFKELVGAMVKADVELHERKTSKD